MLKRIIGIAVMIGVLTLFVTTVNAGILDDIFKQGSNLSGSGGDLGTSVKSFLIDKIVPIIEMIGNLIFAGITVILGLKYIWSSAEGKSEVQESLPAFITAVIFFYMAGTLVNVLIGDANDGIIGSLTGSTTSGIFAGKVMFIITSVVKYAALAGLVFVGVRYMLASAEGRASMKTSMGGLIIGILFTFLASNVITFFVNTGKQIIK